MRQYLDLLRHVLENGEVKADRTGTGTVSVFGWQDRHDLAEGFPLVTTKRVHFKSVAHELLWFLRGETNIRPLLEVGVTIWSEWPHKRYVEATGDAIELRAFEARIREDAAFAAKWGDLGPVYGKQWRRWEGSDGRMYDQVADVVRQLRTNPDSRRIIISGWNVGEIGRMSLPPCHTLYQFSTHGGRLNCLLFQRSCDLLLGCPFNRASAALLTMMLAQVTGFRPGHLVHSIADAHIYSNHIEQVREQLAREPFPLPTLELNPGIREIDDFRFEDIRLVNYQSHGAIKAPVAV